MQKLKEIRDAGFALSDDEVTLGMAAVSAPVFDPRGHVMASLLVSGLRDAILHHPDSSSSIIDLTREGARRLQPILVPQSPASSVANPTSPPPSSFASRKPKEKSDSVAKPEFPVDAVIAFTGNS
jgi:hypothetical protein